MTTCSSAPTRLFKSFFFDSGLGYFFYYILRNDWVWSFLRDDEKDFIRRQNDYWNNNNPGYKDPDKYQGQQGRSFATNDNRCATWEGRMIQKFLEAERPQRVLEVGPGSGYYTRQIIDCPSVVSYYATDINVGFLKSVERAITAHSRASEVTTELLDIEHLDSAKFSVDAIIILSALHHIPDRSEFVRRIAERLAPGGSVFFYEPTHSLARIFQLSWSFLYNRWYSTKVVLARNNYMTHHFCSVPEMKAIARSADCELEKWDIKSRLPKRLSRWIHRPVGKEMVAVLRRAQR